MHQLGNGCNALRPYGLFSWYEGGLPTLGSRDVMGSVASLPRPHKGVEPLPLLPATLPGDTQASTYGVITDTANPNLLITFVADYHIAGQDVLLYEQPSDIPFSTSSAKTVAIGGLEGHLFQDDSGTSALQWYAHGMACQLTSKLPVARLVELASGFQPLKSWELIL